MNHNQKLQQLKAANRRLAMLRFLAEEPDYSLNTSILQEALDSIGIREIRAVIHADGAWLEHLGIITTEDLVSFRVFSLTSLGLDVVEGRIVIDGIKRPKPKV